MPIEPILVLFMVVVAVLIAGLTDLFAAAMLFGIFSLLAAAVFTALDAVDVAFTEAAVGAGISTVLMLATLSLTGRTERQSKVGLLPAVLVAALGATLLLGLSDAPSFGDPLAPIHVHVAPAYIEGSEKDLHIPNVVTSVLASYRGFDTYGETMVIFTAGLGVLLMLGGSRREEETA